MTRKNHKTPMLGLKKRRLPKSTNPISQLFQSIKPFIWICGWYLNSLYNTSSWGYLIIGAIKWRKCVKSLKTNLLPICFMVSLGIGKIMYELLFGIQVPIRRNCSTTKLGTHIHPVPSEVLSNNVFLARQCSTLTWVIALKNVIYEEVSKNSLF